MNGFYSLLWRDFPAGGRAGMVITHSLVVDIIQV